MRTNRNCVVVLALTGLILATAAVSIAEVNVKIAQLSTTRFSDTFSKGVLTDSDKIPNFWTVSTYSKENTSPMSEAIGGPLILRYIGNLDIQGGPRLYSRVDSEFNFFAHPVSLTLAAPPKGTLAPARPPDSKDPRKARAWTFLGLTATSGPGLTDGPNRVVLQLSNCNVLQFSIKDSNNKIFYTWSDYQLPANAMVNKMSLYLDGTGEADDTVVVNFGVEYTNDKGVNFQYNVFEEPFNLGKGDNGSGKTQEELDALKAGFPSGAAVQIQLVNCAP